ncbi:hypothetical protein SETIT_2G219900v2 [Setaria italica]|uniref:Uncharacterized protein n=1 Tax=Setaria italica TaxID=4555 RepID=A0A368Q238_SETIT|nr:hypothetical protein SETIT_2G219900v2 [Setaria italica]
MYTNAILLWRSSASGAVAAGAEAGRGREGCGWQGGGAPEQRWGFRAAARRRRLRSNGRWGGGALKQRWVPRWRHGRHGRGGGEEEALEQRPVKGGREPLGMKGDADRNARTSA